MGGGLAHLCGTTKAAAPPFAVFERWGSRTYGLGLDVNSQGIGVRAPHPRENRVGRASSFVFVVGRKSKKWASPLLASIFALLLPGQR
jgi:hypothetical protein